MWERFTVVYKDVPQLVREYPEALVAMDGIKLTRDHGARQASVDVLSNSPG